VTRTWTRRTAIAAVLLVSAVAAIVSYAHMQELAFRAGEEWRSHLIPLSVDGMLVASTLAIVVRRRESLSVGWVPWAGLALGILASLAANVAAARPEPIPRIIAGWPPAAFALSVELMVIVLRATADPEPVRSPRTPRVAAGGGGPPAPSPAAPKRKRKPQPPAPAELLARTRELAPIGRRQLARELEVSEHTARTLLEAVR
jgi:hypothetical protein